MTQLIVKKNYGSFATFEGAKHADRALPYDYVVFTEVGCKLVRRITHPLLVGILQTTGSKYGFTGKGNSIYLCKPLDEIYPPFYVGSKIIDRVKNKLITFKFDSWDSNSEFPRGTFVDLLGDCGDYAVEQKASLLKANPYKWEKVLPEIVLPSKEGRYVINAPTINIDPDGCKDVDDCISLWDNYLAISIADVSAYVEANPFLRYAEYIGTSLYNSGTCIKPMFPSILSEDLFSLVPGKERLAYSLIIKFDKTITYEFKETIVKVTNSYTYDNVYSCKDINLTLLKNYIQRLSGTYSDDSHKWIEILMLYYNTKAGDYIKTNGLGILRNQSGINLERAKLFEIYSEEYMYLAYESAKYCLPDSITTHSQLGVQHYAHASSPIRRYVDIINQYALKNKVLEYSSLERFNSQQKASKMYERELVFLELYFTKHRVLDGIVLNNEKIFISSLKKVISYPNNLEIKKKVSLKYYCDSQQRRWKDRIVFQLNV